MHLSQSAKKGFVLGVFIISSASFASFHDELGDSEMLPNDTLFKDTESRGKASNIFWELAYKGLAELKAAKDEFLSDTFESSKEEVFEPSKEEVKEEINDTDNQPVKVSWFNKKTALKFGVGAIALVTIGYTTYVLYKNGTLKKLSEVMKKHPYISTVGLAITTLLIGHCGVLALVDNGYLPERFGKAPYSPLLVPYYLLTNK